MSQSIAAKRYALALFDLAQEKGLTGQLREELLELKQVFQTNDKLGELLDSPKLSAEEKKKMLAGAFQAANQYILNTLFVLLEKKRMNEVVQVVDEYVDYANEAAGVADAKVYSTRPLTESESQSISAAFAKKVGKLSLRIENIIDPSLIGGIRLQIGNQIYDSSLSAKLNRMKRDLIGS